MKKKKKFHQIFLVHLKQNLGRTLAPMEYEIINSWIDSGYSEELIIAALRKLCIREYLN